MVWSDRQLVRNPRPSKVAHLRQAHLGRITKVPPQQPPDAGPIDVRVLQTPGPVVFPGIARPVQAVFFYEMLGLVTLGQSQNGPDGKLSYHARWVM